MIRDMLHTKVPFWGLLVTLLIFGSAMLAFFFHLRENILSYSLALSGLNEGNPLALQYGEQPALSDPDVFEKVKSEFMTQGASFIEADLSEMRLRVYKDGITAKEVAILSKGKEGSWWETPAGIYRVQSKTEKHFSSFGRVYQPWSMAFQGNFFIHGWPYYPDGTPVSPGYSGGCIRLSNEDAEEVFSLIKTGTPVLVFEKDFREDGIKYSVRQPVVSAESFMIADIKNNFVFAEKNSREKIPLGKFDQFLGSLVATDYINMEKKITVTEEMLLEDMGTTSVLRLEEDLKITPFDILHLILRESSPEGMSALSGFFGEKRFASLINEKAAALGMGKTVFRVSPDATPLGEKVGELAPPSETVPEDLFRLAKYMYHNRKYILDLSAARVTNTAYGKPIWADIEDKNLFQEDKNFSGGKFVSRQEAEANTEGDLQPVHKGDLFAVFEVVLAGEKRPVFIFLGNSLDVHADVVSALSSISAVYEGR